MASSSFGRNASVDPLFLIERGGDLLSSASASSICRFAMLPLRSSRMICHSGIDLMRASSGSFMGVVGKEVGMVVLLSERMRSGSAFPQESEAIL